MSILILRCGRRGVVVNFVRSLGAARARQCALDARVQLLELPHEVVVPSVERLQTGLAVDFAPSALRSPNPRVAKRARPRIRSGYRRRCAAGASLPGRPRAAFTAPNSARMGWGEFAVAAAPATRNWGFTAPGADGTLLVRPQGLSSASHVAQVAANARLVTSSHTHERQTVCG